MKKIALSMLYMLLCGLLAAFLLTGCTDDAPAAVTPDTSAADAGHTDAGNTDASAPVGDNTGDNNTTGDTGDNNNTGDDTGDVGDNNNTGDTGNENGNGNTPVDPAPAAYLITYNAAGGTVSTPSETVTCGETVTLPTPTRTGYEFLGWYRGDASVTSGVWTYAGNAELTARWRLVETELPLVWHLGYVGSGSNTTNTYKLATNGACYSYTDVFVVPAAGTTITFVDDNTNSNGDTNYASNAALVISSWKYVDDEWVIDVAGSNYAGSGSTLSNILVSTAGGKATYRYTTAADNEALRLCYRSGQTTTFTPAAYPRVAATQTGETPTNPLRPAENVTWNFGYVASSSHATTPNQLVPSGGSYSYTDVIVLPRAGTTVQFVDDNTNANGDNNYASAAAYVFSSWKLVGDEWVLDVDAANYAGSGKNLSDVAVIVSGNTVVYRYTTTLDNEAIRVCFRSGETRTFKPAAYPVIMVGCTGEKGTAYDRLTLGAWAAESRENYYAPQLEGLTVSAIGDSYFAGNGLDKNYVWLSLMARKYDMTLNNNGVNGSTVSNYVTTNNPMCARYTALPAADIILVEGGRNDYNKNVPIGDADSTDTETFSGALNVIIAGLKAANPDAMIVCITPWNFTDTNGDNAATYVDYADAMEAVAARQGVYCIRACDPAVSGVDMRNADFRAEYCMTPGDISHLNLEGMKIAEAHFEPILAAYYAEFTA